MAMVVGALFAFIISWSQYILTLLIGGGRVITLPVLLFSFANSGDNVHIIASGENSTVVSTGVVDSIILGSGGSAALAYHDGERVRFAVAIEGENNIRAGVRYRLNEQHQFVEC